MEQKFAFVTVPMLRNVNPKLTWVVCPTWWSATVFASNGFLVDAKLRRSAEEAPHPVTVSTSSIWVCKNRHKNTGRAIIWASILCFVCNCYDYTSKTFGIVYAWCLNQKKKSQKAKILAETNLLVNCWLPGSFPYTKARHMKDWDSALCGIVWHRCNWCVASIQHH